MSVDDRLVWMRRYPGAFGARVWKSRPCMICQEPGYTVPAPPKPITLAELTDIDLMAAPSLRTEDTCPGHEWAVRRYLASEPQP